MKSSFIDFLKLIFSDKYEMCDKEYKSLSYILLNSGVGSDIFDKGVVQLITMLNESDKSFPMSMECFRSLWENQYNSFNFVSMLSELVKGGILSITKMSASSFNKNEGILKNGLEGEKELYIVVDSSEVLNSLYEQFVSVLEQSKKRVVLESVRALPKKYTNILDKANMLLAKINVVVSLESYTIDDFLGTMQLNLLFKQVSDYSIEDKAITAYAKKQLRRCKGVDDVEAFKEGKYSVYLGFTLDTKSDFRDLADCLYNFIEILEVEGV